mgnify:CR=1 FL=1
MSDQYSDYFTMRYAPLEHANPDDYKFKLIKAAFEMTTTMLRSMIIKALTFATPTDRINFR